MTNRNYGAEDLWRKRWRSMDESR